MINDNLDSDEWWSILVTSFACQILSSSSSLPACLQYVYDGPDAVVDYFDGDDKVPDDYLGHIISI